MENKVEAADVQSEPKVFVDTENCVCPNCGGTVQYDIKSREFLCQSCGARKEVEAQTKQVEEYDFSQYSLREAGAVSFEGLAVCQCKNCGVEIAFDKEEISTVCPMCGSTQIALCKQKSGIPPDGIVPFEVDKHDSSQIIKKWISGLWFAPKSFKNGYQEGQIIGVYVPFWTYDANAVGDYSGRGGNRRVVKDSDGKQRTVTDWHRVSGRVSSSFDDIQICAADAAEAQSVKQILPFDTIHKVVPFKAEYMSGYRAELYSIKADCGFNQCQEQIHENLESKAHEEILHRYDTADVTSVDVKVTDVTYKHLLLPVWKASSGYNGKSYPLIINGETGEIYGERPYSPWKIAAFVAGIIAVLAAAYFGYTLL